MKKITALLLALMMPVCIFAGCTKQKDRENNNPDKTGKLKVITTIFPEYDWVRELLGDKAENAELTMLLDNGVDLHSYQPTADDIVKISTCDLFIHVGGESDGWVEGALKNVANKNVKVINLMEVWLSLKNAEILVGAISDAFQELDPENKDTYAANADAYVKKLSDLDADYRAAVAGAAYKTILFGDRFPFRYLVDDYGLSYYAAFAGCSAETEAGFDTITFLAGKVDELGLPCVMTIEGARHKIAETIVQNTAAKNQKVLTMDSMQSTTSKDAANGTTYLSIMEKNLSVLKQALG